MRRPWSFAAVPLFAAGVARGQDASARDEQEQIKDLLARVELLEREVAELRLPIDRSWNRSLDYAMTFRALPLSKPNTATPPATSRTEATPHCRP